MRRLLILIFFVVVLLLPITLLGQEQDTHAMVPFDEFGQIKGEDVKARLDNLAIALTNDPEMVAYITAWGPEGEGSGTSRNIGLDLKGYLVNTRGISSDRVTIQDAGRYKDPSEARVKLWVVPAQSEAPVVEHFDVKPKLETGKLSEFDTSEISYEIGGEGDFTLGAVGEASIAEMFRTYRKSVAYFVVSQTGAAAPGAWKRIGQAEIDQLIAYGVDRKQVKLIRGKPPATNGDGEDESIHIEFWSLPVSAPPPRQYVGPDPTSKTAISVNTIGGYFSEDDPGHLLQKFADILTANSQVAVCFVVRGQVQSDESPVAEPPMGLSPDPPRHVNLPELAEKWRSELINKYHVSGDRIVIVPAAPTELKEDQIETWLLPPGVPLPDLYANPD